MFMVALPLTNPLLPPPKTSPRISVLPVMLMMVEAFVAVVGLLTVL
jgi:hypothetical protein